jgi:bifunctional enzyme CysN/CysC
LLLDEYTRNASTGSFILIDPDTNGTVAAGMVLRDVSAQTASPNTVRHKSLATAEDRAGHGRTVWFTGLSGSGKSSVAMLVEQKLLEKGIPAYVLDGDNLRHGLNGNLGFSAEDRAENVRRTAHVARLFADAGTIAIASLVSPYESDRAGARSAHDELELDFIEVFVDTPLEECERRDPKGLYAKARAGEISGMTGIDDPYEPPQQAEIVLRGGSVEDAVAEIVARLEELGVIE